MHASAQLVCTTAGFDYGPRTILDDITLTISPGDRIGVVGPNGTGKTTLLRMLCGELEPGAGSISPIPATASIGLLSQQLDDRPGDTVGEFLNRVTGAAAVMQEFEDSLAALAESQSDADERYDLALHRYMALDPASFTENAVRTLESVGASGVGLDRLAAELSGGERTRVNLAAMLLANFDVLLLDEPTNDLDHDGLRLLETMILSSQRPTVVVSHDRSFLRAITTSIFELDDHSHTGTRFNGGFEAWQHARELARQQHYDAFADFNDKRARLTDRARQQQQWSATGVSRAKKDKSEKDRNIRSNRIEASEKVASKAKQTQKALDRLVRTQSVDAPWEPWELQLEFASADRSGSEVAVLQQAVVERSGFTLGPIDATVSAGDRILITGLNGSGKTTLLQALLGELALTSGVNRVGPAVRVASLQQDREFFGSASTLLAGFIEATGLDDAEARGQLAKLGLDTERILRPAGALSPGERTRAALGLFAAVGSNLLVLDEPTNHLDLPAIEQLEAALAVFPHTLLLITHDQQMIDAIETNRQWHLTEGRLVEQ